MASFLDYMLLAIGGTALLMAGAYFHFVFAPAPEPPTLSAPVQRKNLEVYGRFRTYLAYIPAQLPPNPALLLVLHGSKIDGATMRKWTGYEFDELADQYGFIVLYPDGYKNNWNDCRKVASTPTKKENTDDVGFLGSLVKHYKDTKGVDPARVFVFGYSNGGQMAIRLALEQPLLVAAIATVGTSLSTQDNFGCPWQGATPPILMVSNTADKIVPFAGGEVNLLGTNHGRVLSARATAEHFAHRNGLRASPLSTLLESKAGSNPLPVKQYLWQKQGRPIVEWYVVEGGGHVVPQNRFRFPRFNGQTATNLDTPAKAVTFFGLIP